MITRKTAAGLSAAVLATVGIAAAAPSGAAVHPSPAKAMMGVPVTEVTTFTKVLDLAKGSIGDEVIFRSTLSVSDTKAMQRIGSDVGVCTFISPRFAHCSLTAVIPHSGQIEAAGVGPGSGTFSIAVTGGTGDFKGYSGQITVHTITAKRSRLFFDLIPPPAT